MLRNCPIYYTHHKLNDIYVLQSIINYNKLRKCEFKMFAQQT